MNFDSQLPLATQPSEYRGYVITPKGPTSFEITKDGYLVTRCGSRWGCIVYIDERESR